MSRLGELLESVVADVDSVFLFSPSASLYEAFAEADTPVAVVAPENDVDADEYVELPLEFRNLGERIRFGVEGGLDNGYLEEGDQVGCAEVAELQRQLDVLVGVDVVLRGHDHDRGVGLGELLVQRRARGEEEHAVDVSHHGFE